LKNGEHISQCSTNVNTNGYIHNIVYSSNHASRTFKFINTSSLQECEFVLKDVKSLKALPSNSTNIMCMSINDKYIKRPNCLSNVFLIEIVVDHDIINVNKKKHKSHIIHYVHYNEHHDPNFFYKKILLLFIPSFDNEDTFKGHHCTWHKAYNMHGKKKCVKNICILFPQ
jgi:hypothetical protein